MTKKMAETADKAMTDGAAPDNVVPGPGNNPAPYRTAPHNMEAEQALLGAILVNNDAFYRVSDFLEADHFFEPIHRQIYKVTADMIRAAKRANPVTIKTFLPEDERIGDMTVCFLSGALGRRSHHNY